MKKIVALSINIILLVTSSFAKKTSSKNVFPSYSLLSDYYHHFAKKTSDINEHLPILKELARECSSIMEIGIRNMVSTWGILQGLTENNTTTRSYIGIDLNYPPIEVLKKASLLAQNNNIFFQFLAINDMLLNTKFLTAIDMLFIDSLHTYCHLTYELEKFSPLVQKYIAMHDTSAPWGNMDDTEYKGNYSEYPHNYDRTKKGLWPAVQDFLIKHPEWQLEKRYLNNHGLTILKRIAP